MLVDGDMDKSELIMSVACLKIYLSDPWNKYALDMINKTVYSDIPTLLHEECPRFYKNYIKQIKDNKDNSLMIINNTEIEETEIKQVEYLSTDIYRASREIKRMQKIYNNLLCTWIDDDGATIIGIEQCKKDN